LELDLEKLSEEERELLELLLRKAGANPGVGSEDPVDPVDPPEERAEIGPRIISPADWVADWEVGAKAKARKWKRRTLRPKKDPLKEGIAAEGKFVDKMTRGLEAGRRAKGSKAWTFEEWGETIVATKPEDYSREVTRKRYKMRKKIEIQYDLRVYAAKKLDGMPVDTAEQRERKMIAAKRTNEIIGLYIKGVITDAEARRRIDEETKP